MPTKNKSIPDDIQILANAYTGHNQVANRIWILTATICILAFGTDTSVDRIELFNFKLQKAEAFFIITFLVAAGNIAYCSAHLQAYRCADIFQDYLKTHGAEKIKFSEHHNLANACHTLYLPNLNRMYPIRHVLPDSKLVKITYIIVKVFIDIVYVAVPLGGLWVSYEKMGMGRTLIHVTEFTFINNGILWVLFVLVWVSTAVSFINIWQSFDWSYKKFVEK